MKMKSYLPFLSLSFLLLVSVVSYVIWPDGFVPADAQGTLMEPSEQNWLGTDSLGRDYFARLMVGLRISLWVALGSSFISLLLGIFLGTFLVQVSAWRRFLFSRTVDMLQGLPSFMIIAILMQASGSFSVVALSFWMGIFHWPGVARLTQSESLKTQTELYVEAARALGATRFYIFRKHVWPACYSLWLTWFCYHLPAEIMFESSLSFLGFGVQAPQVSLGILIQEAWSYLGVRPLFLLAPAMVIFIIVLCLYQIRSLRLRADKASNRF